MIGIRESKILVTGLLWLGGESRGIGNILCEMLRETKQELIIIAYRLSVAAEDFAGELEAVLRRGCQVKLVLDQVGEQQHPSFEMFLDRLLATYPNLYAWDFLGDGGGVESGFMHAKAVISDRKKAVIGSANFSRNGMVNNHEMAVLVRGASALDAARAYDRLIAEGIGRGYLKVRTAGTS